MKKVLIILVVFGLMANVSPLFSSAKSVSLFANAGVAASDFEGMFFDVGVEFQSNKHLSWQLSFDYYIEPYGDLAFIDKNKAYGPNVYVVYKLHHNEKLSFFGKAGVNYTFVESEMNLNLDINGEPMNLSIEGTSSSFGIGVGAGIEYHLNDTISLVTGVTYKRLLSEGGANWFKFYGGVSYTL